MQDRWGLSAPALVLLFLATAPATQALGIGPRAT
jgi:hypothetical protein